MEEQSTQKERSNTEHLPTRIFLLDKHLGSRKHSQGVGGWVGGGEGSWVDLYVCQHLRILENSWAVLCCPDYCESARWLAYPPSAPGDTPKFTRASLVTWNTKVQRSVYATLSGKLSLVTMIFRKQVDRPVILLWSYEVVELSKKQMNRPVFPSTLRKQLVYLAQQVSPKRPSKVTLKCLALISASPAPADITLVWFSDSDKDPCEAPIHPSRWPHTDMTPIHPQPQCLLDLAH